MPSPRKPRHAVRLNVKSVRIPRPPKLHKPKKPPLVSQVKRIKNYNATRLRILQEKMRARPQKTSPRARLLQKQRVFPRATIRARRYVGGIIKGVAKGIRVAVPPTAKATATIAREGYRALRSASSPVLYWGGRIGVDALNIAGETTHNLSMAALRTTTDIATSAVGTGLELSGRSAKGIVRGSARLIEGTVRVTPRAIAYLSKTTARKVLQYLADRRAINRIVNPNLAFKWRLVFRPEGVPVTGDGFIVHTIQRSFGIGKRKTLLQVNIEYGFNEKGRLIVRAFPVLTGNPERDAIINRVYAKKFRIVRVGVRSLTKRLGGSRAIIETYMTKKAFPEERYAGIPTETAPAEGLVPEDVAIKATA